MQQLFSESASVKGNIIVAYKNEAEEDRITDYLLKEGYGVYKCKTFRDFMEINHVNLRCILVEVTLGNDSTFHAIEMIKQLDTGIRTPLLVVADVASTENIVKALNAGANDYILFPYSRKEILQRVMSLTLKFFPK